MRIRKFIQNNENEEERLGLYGIVNDDKGRVLYFLAEGRNGEITRKDPHHYKIVYIKERTKQ